MDYIFKGADPYSSHNKIICFLRQLGNNLYVLDVGCAGGYISQYLSNRGHTVYGLEINPKSAKKAAKFCKNMIVGDVETIHLPYKENFFDVIICGDVLEHLKDPQNTLIKLKKYLKKGGHIIISTGNIANIYIRLSLLFGRFEYQERGILDKTHCKLFTLSSLKKLVNGAGLRIKQLEVAPVPLPIIFPITGEGKPLFLIQSLNNLITKIFKKLFAFQFIVLVGE